MVWTPIIYQFLCWCQNKMKTIDTKYIKATTIETMIALKNIKSIAVDADPIIIN